MTPTPSASRAKKSPLPTNASEIAPGVFVGGWNDAVGFPGTKICVLDDPPAEPIPGASHVPIYDEAKDQAIRPNLDRVAALVSAARGRKESVLLFCGHGVRRGSLAGAWYLHSSAGISLDAAYDQVRSVRPKIEVLHEWVGNWQALEPGSAAAKKSGRGDRAA
ncbi:MAG: dual specificity protein phosphatase family protein [Thermoplasmata archaeon]|nr:dual specificity protein phosphatase family protein [Thermoplasmata archaeon]